MVKILVYSLQITEKKENKTKKNLTNFTSIIVEQLPTLLTVFSLDLEKVKDLIKIIKMLDLSVLNKRDLRN